MDGPPQRPADVPAAAVWMEQAAEWELIPVDERGRKQGLGRSWRTDGTLASETTYAGDAADGPYRRFHPNGQVAREGRFVQGNLEGTLIAHGCDQPTTEPLQVCCVPANAWQLQVDYDRGQAQGQRWYDRAGVHILPSGNPFPAHPETVPEDANFQEEIDAWVSGVYTDKGEPQGLWRRWSRSGVLLAHEEHRDGKRHGQWRYFRPDGALLEEAVFRDGKRTGPYRCLAVPAGRYPDGRIVEERGAFDRELAVGVWTLHDADGAQLRRYDLGIVPSDEVLSASPVFGDHPPAALTAAPATAWATAADALETEGRLGESVIAMARAAANARDPDGLRLLLARRCCALTAAASEDLALDLAKTADGDRGVLMNGLPRGADPVGILRALASSLGRSDRVARDLADAAVLLAPERPDCRVTRGLIRLHMGDLRGAAADAAHLPDDWAEQRDFIVNYARILFPTFDFWPTAHPVETLFPDVPEGIDQSLEAVRGCIQKLATRLTALRDAIQKAAGAPAEPPWHPPALSALLPEGSLPLETWTFDEIVEEEPSEDAGPADDDTVAATATPTPPQPTLVTVDERLPLDGVSLPTLMRLARREWGALTWLCWSVGLDHVGLPTALHPPADFGKACGMSVERLWRCEDKVITGGLRALSQKVPGFSWEGIAVDELPPLLAEIATDDYRELRALFFWLCDGGVQSLWQDNLRGNA